MVKDVRKDSTSLRDIVKPFRAKIGVIDESRIDGILHAPHSDFIVVDNKKFYLNIPTAQELNSAQCGSCFLKSSGFAVALMPHEDFPDKFMVAFQCDSCEMIQIIDFTKVIIAFNEKGEN